MPKPKVSIYSTPTCPWCNKMKEFLKANKISFKNIDVSKSKKNAERMFKKSGQLGVPVTEINGKLIIGYDETEIKKALKIK